MKFDDFNDLFEEICMSKNQYFEFEKTDDSIIIYNHEDYVRIELETTEEIESGIVKNCYVYDINSDGEMFEYSHMINGEIVTVEPPTVENEIVKYINDNDIYLENIAVL